MIASRNDVDIDIMPENTTRKIDSLGRIGVPKGIRNRMKLEINQEMEFFTLRFEDGEEYVAFKPVARDNNNEDKYLQVAELLNELGVAVPAEVLEHI